MTPHMTMLVECTAVRQYHKLGWATAGVMTLDDFKQIASIAAWQLTNKYPAVDGALVMSAVKRRIMDEVRQLRPGFRKAAYHNGVMPIHITLDSCAPQEFTVNSQVLNNLIRAEMVDYASAWVLGTRSKLSRLEREFLLLHYIHEIKQVDIAEQNCMTPSEVNVIIQRAIRSLRRTARVAR